MTRFDTLFAEQALPALLDMYGEEIVYRPLNGLPRTITAIVDRQPPQPLPGMKVVAPRLIITVENDAVRGVTTADIDRGGDEVEVAVVKGGTPETLAVKSIEGDHGGCTIFGVR